MLLHDVVIVDEVQADLFAMESTIFGSTGYDHTEHGRNITVPVCRCPSSLRRAMILERYQVERPEWGQERERCWIERKAWRQRYVSANDEG